jgi:hypothetical protein
MGQYLTLLIGNLSFSVTERPADLNLAAAGN